MSARGEEHVLLAAGLPAAVSTTTTPFKAYGNSLTLWITTTTGGAGTCTFTIVSGTGATPAFKGYDTDSAYTESINVNAADTYEFTVNYPFIPGQYYALYYSCGAAAGTIAINALSWENPAGTSSLTLGDVNVNVAALEVLSTAANALLTTIAAATGGTAGTSYMFSEDASFVTGDSPATVDVNAGLGYNGNLGWITNDGAGDFTIEISKVGTPTLGSSITIRNGEVFSFDGLDVDQFTITWVADSSYRYFIQ